MKDVQIHGPLVKKKNLLPVLNTVLVKDGERVSTDLDRYVRTQTDLPNGLYRLVGTDWVKSPISQDEFPPPPPVSGTGVKLELDRITAKRLLACMSTDETRYILNSILFRVHAEGVTLTSTDGRRATTCEWPRMDTDKRPIPKKAQGDYVVPHQGNPNTHPLAMLLKDKQRDTLTMQTEVPYMHLSNGEQTISVKLTDGTYPNYKQVIPVDDEGLFYVERDEMIEALKEALPYTNDDFTVQLHMEKGNDGNVLRIHAENVDEALVFDRCVSVEHVRRVKKVDRLALDVRYLLDTFIQEEGLVYFGYTDALAPVDVGTHIVSRNKRDQIDRTDITVLMPMRIT